MVPAMRPLMPLRELASSETVHEFRGEFHDAAGLAMMPVALLLLLLELSVKAGLTILKLHL